MWKALGCAVALGAIALGIGVAPARAAEVTIRFPVEYAIDIAPGLSNQDFKKLIEERTNGRVEVKLFPSGSLYKGLDLVQAILRGDAEMSTLTSAYWTALSPKVAALLEILAELRASQQAPAKRRASNGHAAAAAV